MNYSLFIMVLREMETMEVKRQPRAAPTGSPLLSSKSANLYCVSLAPYREIAWGVLFIVGLGQDGSVKPEFQQLDPQGARWAPPRGQLLGHCGRCSFAPRVVPRWLLLLTVLYFLKNDVEKRLSLFDVWKVRQSQRHAKQKTCPVELEPNERGLFRKSIESMKNMSRTLINYKIYKNMI
jgi:hypothetical protein